MPHRMIRLTLLVAGLVLSAAGPAFAAPPRENRQLESLRSRHAELKREQAAELSELAAQLERIGATDAAHEAYALAVSADPQRIVVNRLPRRVQPEPTLTLPAGERSLRLKLRKLREEQSVDLYMLSRQALTAKSTHYAYELLREAAARDPDNPTARRVLGFLRMGDEWLTPFEARMRRSGNVWDETFGWLPDDHVERYKAGERYHQGRWISKENDVELHRDFDHGWVTRTEHYLVKTNHSLERGVEIASRLETYHAFFVETFAGFFSRPEDLQTLFRGTSTRNTEAKPYEVHYFATRDEYNKRLVAKIPTIAVTNGLYYTEDRVAYFFHDEKLTLDDTLYHEATHQYMYESRPRDRLVATQAHFWVIEGIACYMESFKPGEEALSLGNPNHARIDAARYRYLTEGVYTPLGQFASMGLTEFQTLPLNEMQRNYSQAAGLAHFFMHYDGGRYRDALIEHLAQLYNGAGPTRRQAQNLAELTGVSYTELDRQYGEYMRNLGEPRAAVEE
ncbi:MAG: DUF1570 domain-containing protein [Planctomycetaceae bacterium]